VRDTEALVLSARNDVYEQELVVDGGHPLFGFEKVVCTPHIGYVTRDECEQHSPMSSTRSSPSPRELQPTS